MIRAAYGMLLALLAALWVALLAAPLLSTHPEMDLWWMMPLMEKETAGRSGPALWAFLMSPAPFLLGQPLLKCYLFLHTSMVGFSVPKLLGLAMFLHALNAWGVYRFGRALSLSRRVATIAGVIYLTMFAHFHAYMWPTAVQHLLAVSTVLLLLNLYLAVERRSHEGKAAGALRMITLGIMGLASIQRGALLGPLLMLVHTLWSTGSSNERLSSFNRWLPGWVLTGIYPAFALAWVGDPRVTAIFAQWPVPLFLKTLVLWGAGASALVALGRLLPSWDLLARRRRLWIPSALAVLAGGLLLWALWDHRQAVFFYNAMVPFSSTLSSFLDPIRTVFLIPSTEPYHILPPQVSIWILAASAAMILVFSALVPDRRTILPLFGVWYAVGLLYFLQPYSSFPVRIPSRYFIYLSPLFAVIFSSVFCWACESVARRLRLKPLLREACLLSLIAGLCVPNIVAIRLELFRGRLANTYLLYEELLPPEDPFALLMQRAQSALKAGEIQEARADFERAARARPFLLRYLLSSYSLEDARWMTGGGDVRQWVSDINRLYGAWGKELAEWDPVFRRVSNRLQGELSDYIFCLFALAFLDHQNGDREQSERWLSQIGFLEEDGWRLSAWMQEDPRVKPDTALREFARGLKDPARFPDPLPWRKDDYGFGLFMMRFLSRW